MRSLSWRVVVNHGVDIRGGNVSSPSIPEELLEKFSNAPPPYIEHQVHRISERTQPRTRPKIYLSAATLIVVPPVLADQWILEFQKHTKGGSLTILRVDNTRSVPDIETMINLDVVLVTQNVLTTESFRRFCI